MVQVLKFEPYVVSHRLVGFLEYVNTVVCMLLGLLLAALALVGTSSKYARCGARCNLAS